MQAPAAATASGRGAPTNNKLAKKDPKKQFLFAWDDREDTSADVNALYANRLAPALAFGRGYQAGIDKREQRKSSMYAETLERLRQGHANADGDAAVAGASQMVELDDAAAVRSSAAEQARRAPDAVSRAATNAAQLTRLSGDRESAAAAIEASSIGLPGSHWSEKSLDAMTERDWRIMREDFDIRVRGGRALYPLRKWDECAMAPSLRRAIDEMGYKQPSPIQRQAIPMGLAGRDLIGIAETGSGKTAAFLIPLLTFVLNHPPAARARVADQGPLALIMAPTRELAQQIAEECEKIAVYSGVTSASVVGGVSIAEQGVKLRTGVDVVIGTPGRLIDTIESRFLVLHQCRYVVLDEADRMIDLGFEPQVTAVLDAMGAGLREAAAGAAEGATAASSAATAAATAGGEEQAAAAAAAAAAHVVADAAKAATARTTHMFSATFPSDVQKLARKYLVEPATVQIGDQDSGKNRRISQDVKFVASETKKRSLLIEVLTRSERPVIIFVNAKKQVRSVIVTVVFSPRGVRF